MATKSTELQRLAESLGFEAAGRSGRDHRWFTFPGTDVRVVVPGTPGRGRSMQNNAALLRRKSREARAALGEAPEVGGAGGAGRR